MFLDFERSHQMPPRSSLPHDARNQKTIAALYHGGYQTAALSVLSGLSRVINVKNDEDWLLFQTEMGEHRSTAWFGDNMESFVNDQTFMAYTLSYRHVHWQIRNPRGATMNEAQWERLRAELFHISSWSRVDKFVLWIDQILHCSKSLSEGVNWVTKGLLPYVVLPVLYIGGPDERNDKDSMRRLWPAIERYAALTSGGIALRGTMRRTAVIGADIHLAPSLSWIASRIIAGTFNGCELSWTKDYLSFREVSLHILRASEPIGCVNEFLKLSSDQQDVTYELVSTFQAFEYSRDDINLSSTNHPISFPGTYLAVGRITTAMTDSGRWHGLREWVQYKWDDGVLPDETADELKGVVKNTHWGLYLDNTNKRHIYAVGVVSRQGELRAMGVAHLKGVTEDGSASVLWFQRGLPSLRGTFCRQIISGLQPNRGLIMDIAEHWHISIGDPIALVKGNSIRWKWSSS